MLGLGVATLGLDEPTLLALAIMVPWFQRVCGGLAVWTDRLRSILDIGGYLEREGAGGRGLLVILLLRLRSRRRNGCSSSSSAAGAFRSAEASGVGGKEVKRVANT